MEVLNSNSCIIQQWNVIMANIKLFIRIDLLILNMKISRSFELHNMEPSYQQVLNHKSPKHPKSPISNKLTLTSELKIKQ